MILITAHLVDGVRYQNSQVFFFQRKGMYLKKNHVPVFWLRKSPGVWLWKWFVCIWNWWYTSQIKRQSKDSVNEHVHLNTNRSLLIQRSVWKTKPRHSELTLRIGISKSVNLCIHTYQLSHGASSAPLFVNCMISWCMHCVIPETPSVSSLFQPENR